MENEVINEKNVNKVEKGDTIQEWIRNIDPNALNLWREAMAQFRQLHNDVWNGLRFFLTINGIIIAAGFAFLREEWNVKTGVAIIALMVIGFAITYLALRIFQGQREYYLDMMAKKALLEKELGFYDVSLYGADISFPWGVPVNYLDKLATDPSQWQKQRIWEGKITPYLKYTYWILKVLYVLVTIFVIIGFVAGYFVTS